MNGKESGIKEVFMKYREYENKVDPTLKITRTNVTVGWKDVATK